MSDPLRQRLLAILAADAAGYSRLMTGDEAATVAALDAARGTFRRHVEAHRGRVVDTAGDSVLAVFETAAGATQAALAIQQGLDAAFESVPEERRMRFRIGLHIGDVIEKPDGSVYGDGVNVAARLQTLAAPGGITVSDAVRSAVRSRVAAAFEDQGEHEVKNIAWPVRAFRLAGAAPYPAVDVSAPVPGFGGRPAIAVLPFDNLSGDKEQEYFVDGLAEDILTRLAMWRWVPVIARNSSFACRGADVKEVGRALGARYVLEGSVRRAGNRVRVTAQLIDAESAHHVWAERYDRVLEDLFALQDELTDGIVGVLEDAVGRAEGERARHKPPSSLDAWDAFQRGWWHALRTTREDVAAAAPLFRRAAELDPGFAAPLAAAAFLRLLQAFFLWAKPAEAFPEAAVQARAALAADGLDPLAHAVLGYVLAFTGRHAEAIAMARKAVELNPSFATGHHACAAGHMFAGDARAAIRACELAIRISPNDLMLHAWFGTLSACLYLARDYERAVEIARLGVQRNPKYPIAWRSLANALGQLGRLEEAREALGQFLALMPGYTTEAAARASVGFRDEPLFQHYLEGLRKAGWKG